jgi:signal peptidase I
VRANLFSLKGGDVKTCLVVVAVALSVQLSHAQTPRYARGDVVRLTAQANGNQYPDSRIIAVAGDRVHIDRSSLTVNGASVEGVSPKLLQSVSEPWDQLIPDGHYFVVGESGVPNDMVRFYGMVPAAKIVRKILPIGGVE